MVDVSNPIALMKHVGDIKRRLVLFSQQSPHGSELNASIRETQNRRQNFNNETLVIIAHDEFIHTRRLRCSKRRILDHFIESDKLLSEEDRKNLDGFRDFHIGMLEVLEYGEHNILVQNLVNGWRGVVWANTGIEVLLEKVPVGSFLLSGLVNFGETVWLSGCQVVYSKSERPKVVDMAAFVGRRTTNYMLLGNSKMIDVGFAAQNERHELFLRYFGGEYTICKSAVLNRTMQDFERFNAEHLKGPDGLTLKERLIANGEADKWKNFSFSGLELPEYLKENEEITIFSTPEGGIYFDVISPPIISTLKTGSLKEVLRLRKVLKKLITSDDHSPFIIRIMARNFADLFAAAVKEIFGFRTFTVVDNLEPLLFKYRGMEAELPRYPTLIIFDPNDPVFQEVYGYG